VRSKVWAGAVTLRTLSAGRLGHDLVGEDADALDLVTGLEGRLVSVDRPAPDRTVASWLNLASPDPEPHRSRSRPTDRKSVSLRA